MESITLPALTIIPASAGSGKTYTIQQRLGEWVVKGLVAPERILAVTFTEATAAELSGRIRANLHGLGRLEEALKLDQAYISTIHSFGMRVLTEFAFDEGLSPRPRLLSPDEENTLIGLSLARTKTAERIISDLDKYGYRHGYNISPEQAFQADLLNIVKLLRATGNSRSQPSNHHQDYAADWIRDRYGAVSEAPALNSKLTEAVAGLLELFPNNLALEYANSLTAKNELNRDYQNLRAMTDPKVVASNWGLWQKLRELRQSKRGNSLPVDYDDLTTKVISCADNLPRHPGPRDLAIEHITLLIAAGQEVLEHYADAKREAGLVDYGDMIAMAAEMLANRPEVRRTLAERLDCLVVDEFQDTNPMQFAFLWQLRKAGVPTLAVGDLKQAIMGFQGADPQLFSTLIRQNRQQAAPLTSNWRSQPKLMHIINAVGEGLFEDYDPLQPQGKYSTLEPLEIIRYRTKPKSRGHVVHAQAMATRIESLLEDSSQQINDKRSGNRRRLRGGDIAVLCPTTNILEQTAEVLRKKDLRVLLQADGWFESNIVQLACLALAYVANPQDRHAALYLSVTELGQHDLKTALLQLMKKGRIIDPVLNVLDGMTIRIEDRTIYALLAEVIAALKLFDLIATWPDADQARANLLRLQAEAGAFMDANREALASGGYHGCGIQSFLAWLNAGFEEMNNQPQPRVIDEDAIQLITWHSSKGREWPVVFVSGLLWQHAPTLPELTHGYSSFEDLSCLLENARIEYSPKFAAAESNRKFLDELEAKYELEGKRLLYVALTRASEKLVLDWPEYSEDKEMTYWSHLSRVLSVNEEEDGSEASEGTATESTVKQQENDVTSGPEFCHVTAVDSDFRCRCWYGGSHVQADPENDPDDIQTELLRIGRRAIRRGEVPVEGTPDSVSPSTLHGSMEKTSPSLQGLQTESYHPPLELDIGLFGTELGSFVHRCFEILHGRTGMPVSLADATGVAVSDHTEQAIVDCVASFEQWVNDRFEPLTLYRELPLLGLDDKGSVVSGTADLVVQTRDGVWIIDHKSDQIDDPKKAFNQYRPQLECYASLLQSAGHVLLGMCINWIRRGEVALLLTVAGETKKAAKA